jgi:hypothetical protein
MGKRMYTPNESYSLLMSNTQYLLEKEEKRVKDLKVEINKLKRDIELSEKMICDFRSTLNILNSHPGITYEFE